jgi:hypothetical protein
MMEVAKPNTDFVDLTGHIPGTIRTNERLGEFFREGGSSPSGGFTLTAIDRGSARRELVSPIFAASGLPFRLASKIVDGEMYVLSTLHQFGHDAFVVAGTRGAGVAGGRSVLRCFPLRGSRLLITSGLAADALTLVVSPLIALMKDQVDALNAKGDRRRPPRFHAGCGPVFEVYEKLEAGSPEAPLHHPSGFPMRHCG